MCSRVAVRLNTDPARQRVGCTLRSAAPPPTAAPRLRRARTPRSTLVDRTSDLGDPACLRIEARDKIPIAGAPCCIDRPGRAPRLVVAGDTGLEGLQSLIGRAAAIEHIGDEVHQLEIVAIKRALEAASRRQGGARRVLGTLIPLKYRGYLAYPSGQGARHGRQSAAIGDRLQTHQGRRRETGDWMPIAV